MAAPEKQPAHPTLGRRPTDFRPASYGLVNMLRHFVSWFLMRHHATEVLARFGYAARGVVYLIIGFFSGGAAFGSGRPSGKKEALRALLSQPAGDILLGAVAVGLVGFSVWRVFQAVLD